MDGVYAKLVDLFQDTSTASLSRGEMPGWRGPGPCNVEVPADQIVSEKCRAAGRLCQYG